MTLTRATRGKIAKRQTKEVQIGGEAARIQKPSPLEYSQYQTSLIGKVGAADISKFSDAILLLVARMWIDDSGERLFKDSETKDLGSIDLEFYQKLSEACQSYAQGGDASKTLGESGETTGLDLPVASV